MTPPHNKDHTMRSSKIPVILNAVKDPCILLAAARISVLIALAVCFTPHAHAQGCAQCLDSTRATPPSVQAAYRHAIFLLGGTAATLFIAGTLVLRRNR